MNDRTSEGRRVLSIAGASFTDALLAEYAYHMGKDGLHTFSALGLGQSAGRPMDTKTYRFSDSRPFPKLKWPPQNIKDALRTLKDLALASPPPDGVGPIDNRSHQGSLKSKICERLLWSEYRRQLLPFLSKYDVYHWHCIEPSRLSALRLIPRSGKVILTPWGSDLYRTAGIAEYARQLNACRRASVITLPSPEMREVFLAKFGREFSSRTRLILYGTEKLAVIDKVHREGNASLARFNLPRSTLVVCVGNSASRGNQHTEILRSLNSLSTSILSRITLVLPMTYGLDASYLTAVKQAIPRNIADLVIIKEPLSREEVAQLRCCTDMLIHLPISDAFSAAMCECLYAGAVMITGSWLPYSPLRTNNVYYHEVNHVSDTANSLRFVVQNYEKERRKTRAARAIIGGLVSWHAVVPRWRSLYDELLS